MKQLLPLCLTGLVFLACNYSGRTIDAALFDQALRQDSLEQTDWPPFHFFKSGYFLSNREKNALLITCPDDSTYRVALYTQIDQKWVKNSEISDISAFPIQFDYQIDDYNFDGQRDIFIRYSASNGYSLAYGHLLLVNKESKQLELHPEAFTLANLKPEPREQLLISEDQIECDNGLMVVCQWINQWKDGKIETIRKNCPCEAAEKERLRLQ